MGGLNALKTLIGGLPAGLPATILIVRHVQENAPDVLAGLLNAAGPLTCRTASDGEELRHGTVLIAPPGCHLLLREGRVRVTFGPSENRWRPAIDPLFRSAAVEAGSRVIGVVLTGLLDDGSSGLAAIKTCGGLAVVQSPDDAEYPEMPTNALHRVEADHVVPLIELPDLLAHLVSTVAPPGPPAPRSLQLEAAIAARSTTDPGPVRELGDASQVTCPDCGGVLIEIEDGTHLRYRCSTGHAYGTSTLLAAKNRAVEESLWVALRTMEERTTMLENMMRDHARNGFSDGSIADKLEENRLHAGRIRELLFGEE